MREGEKAWRRGEFLAETVERTALLNAEAVGKCAALEGLLTMRYEDYLTYAEEEPDAD